MLLKDAKELVSLTASIAWMDCHREHRKAFVVVLGTRFEPLYGHYLITDQGDIALDHIYGWNIVRPSHSSKRVRPTRGEAPGAPRN